MSSVSIRGPVVVVIPARGGSKGIPRKNLANVGGHSLVGRAIIAARSARLVDQVVVSTDDKEIAGVAQRYGADVIMRPAEISGDTASSEAALLHVVSTRRSSGDETGIVVLLQCTAPFTTGSDIDGTIAPVLNDRADSCFAACLFQHFVWEQGSDGVLNGSNHVGGPRQRRQDVAPQFLEAGSVYAVAANALEEAKNRFCGRLAIHEVNPERVFEIDLPSELRLAQQISPILDQRILSDLLPVPLQAIVFDFDGVFTDNAVMVDERGGESVRASRSDGFGIEMLRRDSIPMLVISKERNRVVEARCEKLRLPLKQGVEDKLSVLKAWLLEHNIDRDKTVYVGNDVNDLECIRHVGCSVAPADSHPSILRSVDYVLNSAGGNGAIRELCDAVVTRRKY